MPVYEYKCLCGKRFDRFLPLSRYDEPQECDCGQVAIKQLSAPVVRGDFAGYSCPITGKWIEGRRAHEENLARHGCRVLESGETEQAKRNAAAADDAFAERIAETAVSIVEQMPSAKREQLGREIQSGLDVAVERRSV